MTVKEARRGGKKEVRADTSPCLQRRGNAFVSSLLPPLVHVLEFTVYPLLIHFFCTSQPALLPARVFFWQEFAEAEEKVGNTTGAATLRGMANNMDTAMNALLWATDGKGLGGDDHYVTQLNPDNSTRDFMDYDR